MERPNVVKTVDNEKLKKRKRNNCKLEQQLISRKKIKLEFIQGFLRVGVLKKKGPQLEDREMRTNEIYEYEYDFCRSPDRMNHS